MLQPIQMKDKARKKICWGDKKIFVQLSPLHQIIWWLILYPIHCLHSIFSEAVIDSDYIYRGVKSVTHGHVQLSVPKHFQGIKLQVEQKK